MTFEDETRRFGQRLNLNKQKMGATREAAFDRIKQDNAINSSKAALWDFGAETISSIGAELPSLIEAYKSR